MKNEKAFLLAGVYVGREIYVCCSEDGTVHLADGSLDDIGHLQRFEIDRPPDETDFGFSIHSADYIRQKIEGASASNFVLHLASCCERAEAGLAQYKRQVQRGAEEIAAALLHLKQTDIN